MQMSLLGLRNIGLLSLKKNYNVITQMSLILGLRRPIGLMGYIVNLFMGYPHDVKPMLNSVECWPSVVDGEATLKQHSFQHRLIMSTLVRSRVFSGYMHTNVRL